MEIECQLRENREEICLNGILNLCSAPKNLIYLKGGNQGIILIKSRLIGCVIPVQMRINSVVGWF